MACLAGQLFLRRVPFPQRHCDELPNQSCLDAEAVQPRLVRDYQVVLGMAGEFVLPLLARQGVYLSCGHLNGHWVRSVKVDPQCFRLIHGQEDSTVLAPGFRHPARIVVYVVERNGAKARRQGIVPVVVWYAQCALETHPKFGKLMHLWEPEPQLIVL